MRHWKIKKVTALFMLFILILSSILPGFNAAQAAPEEITVYGGAPAAWPGDADFVVYPGEEGASVYDPANEPGISPDDVDFMSGAMKGAGDRPSFYVAGDGDHLFFRMRLMADPRNDKGGYLSSVWMVQLSNQDGVVATVGLNGKSPHEDYIYVANSNGSLVRPIYKTDSTGSHVPGTRVVEEAGTGDYLLDVQVPIDQITSVDASVNRSSVLQYTFATSKSANLSVINKDGMEGPGAPVKLAPFAIYRPTLTWTDLMATEGTLAGLTTFVEEGQTVQMTVTDAKGVSANYTVPVAADGSWSKMGISLAEGSYTARAMVANQNGDQASATGRFELGGARIGIYGGDTVYTFDFPSTITGYYSRTGTSGGYQKFDFTLYELMGTTKNMLTTSRMNSGDPWSVSTSSLVLSPGKTYQVEAQEVTKSGSNEVPNPNVLAVQTIHYLSGAITLDFPSSTTVDNPGSPTTEVRGKANPNTEVSFYILDTDRAVGTDDVPYRTVMSDGQGDWSLDIDRPMAAKPPGSPYYLKAVMKDSAGNSRASASVRYDVISVDVNIENQDDTVYVTNATPTVRGRTTDTAVEITFEKSGGGSLSLTDSEIVDGKWSVRVPDEHVLEDGAQYSVIARTVHGNPRATASTEYRVKTSTFVEIATPAMDSIVDVDAPVTGTAEPGATVYVTINESVVKVVAADVTTGDWTYTPEDVWAYSEHKVTAVTSDIAGNTATDTVIFTVVDPNNIRTVSFDSNGGSVVSAKQVVRNQTVAAPSDPVREGYLFKGWFTDEALQQPYDFTEPVTDSFTLYAGWEEVVQELEQVEPVMASPASGTVNPGTPVGLSTATTGAIIYYTTDGNTPSVTSSVYSESILVQEAMTIKAIAVREGYRDSEMRSYTYVLPGDPATGTVTGNVYSATGGVVTDLLITALDSEGALLGSDTTDAAGGYTITGLPAGTVTVSIANSTETLVSAEPVVLPGDTVRQDLTLPERARLSLSAEPSEIVGDGISTSVLTASVLDLLDQPVAGVTVRYETTAGTLDNAVKMTSDRGEAMVVLTSEQLSGIEPRTEELQVVVRDLERGIFAEETITMRLLPATIEGIVTSGGQPIANAEVKIDMVIDGVRYVVSAITDEDGRYSLVIPKVDQDYVVQIHAPITVAGTTVWVDFEQVARVGGDTAPGESVTATNQISGYLFISGTPQSGDVLTIDEVLKHDHPILGRIFDEDGEELTGHPITIGADGKFQVDQLPTGTYTLLFQLVAPPPSNERLAGIKLKITIHSNGEIVIAPGLIDPYGIVTVAGTSTPIEGVDMQLYWADTPLNAAKGRTKDTRVPLPRLDFFGPNWNENPQSTTADGEYAWMVFANGDYYFKGTKDGYEVFDSREDTRQVSFGDGDSWIEDGIIHVGESIVEYDFSLDPNPTGLPRSGKDIVAYEVPGQIADATLDAAAGTIAITVEHGTDLTDIIASFTLSPGASAKVGSVPQVSGTTSNSYGSPITYTVTAEDGSSKTWIVTITAETLEKVNADIKDALKQLKVRYQQGDIWESITLPIFLLKDGAHNTVVGWTSNQPDVINIEEVPSDGGEGTPREFVAHVHRQSKDVSVILTATVSKGLGTPLSRTFLLIVKSNAIDEEKVTEERADSKVVVDGQEVAVDVNRTTLSNGSKIDKLIVSAASMDQLLTAGSSTTNQLKLTFSDKPNGNVSQRADELAMELSIAALEKLSVTTELDLQTPEGSIRLTPATLAQMKEAGIDLFFRIVPIRDASSQSVISEQTRQDAGVIRAAGTSDIRILDIPRTIETNYTGLATDVTLPLTHMTLPSDPTELGIFLDSLRVFIQHSDGTTRVVRGTGLDAIPGTIVYEGGVPVGIQFTLTKFSTFTIFQTVTPAPTPTATPTPTVTDPEAPVAVKSSSGQLDAGQIEIELTKPVSYFDPAAFLVSVGGVNVELVSVEQVDGKLQIKLAAPVAAGYQIVVSYDPEAAAQTDRIDALPELEAILMNEVVHYKYINGYPDGAFRPEGAISRAEVAAMLTRLINRSNEQSLPDYVDVSSAHWAAPAIQVMKETGIMLGYGDGRFKPDQAVTRGEIAVIILRFMNYRGMDLPAAEGTAFPDTAHHWAGSAVSTLKTLEVMHGENGRFYPDRPLRRSEAVKALNKVLGRGGLTGDFAPSWPDAQSDHWAYAQIEEASRSHEATRISPEAELLIRFID